MRPRRESWMSRDWDEDYSVRSMCEKKTEEFARIHRDWVCWRLPHERSAYPLVECMLKPEE